MSDNHTPGSRSYYDLMDDWQTLFSPTSSNSIVLSNAVRIILCG